MIEAVHVVWVTAGLGCDGDTIAMTAASLPSIEELVAGALPGVPRVILHNPVLAYENGDAFMQSMRDAASGKLDPFVLVVEGSIPNEKNKTEGYWAAVGVDPATGQPILTCDWIDRLAHGMAPASRMWRVRRRVSTPAMPGTPWRVSQVPRSSTARQLDGRRASSRTTTPRQCGRRLSWSSGLTP